VHLTDHAWSRLPLREWALAVPERPRYRLHRDPAVDQPRKSHQDHSGKSIAAEIYP